MAIIQETSPNAPKRICRHAATMRIAAQKGSAAAVARGACPDGFVALAGLKTDRTVDDIKRATLHLGVDSSDIGAENAGHEHVGAAEEGDKHNDRTPAALEMRACDPHADHREAVKDGETGNGETGPERKSQ